VSRTDSASRVIAAPPATVFAALVEEPRRIVEAADFVSADPDLSGTMTVTWTVDEHLEGSMVTVTARDVPAGISRHDHETAFASTLANLDDFVSS
jgi:hypothetical protein